MPSFEIHAMPWRPADFWLVFAVCEGGRTYWTVMEGEQPTADDAERHFAYKEHAWQAVPVAVGV